MWFLYKDVDSGRTLPDAYLEMIGLRLPLADRLSLISAPGYLEASSQVLVDRRETLSMGCTVPILQNAYVYTPN